MDRESIFVQALAIQSDADRFEFLREQCGDEPALRAEIESLLEAYQGAGSFLEKPPAELAATIHSGESMLGESWQDILEPSGQEKSLGSLAGYEVEELLGRGGMGVVLKARDLRLNRTVAIKLLAPELAANAMAVKRFLREARAAAAVSHDHVLTIHAIEESAKPPLIVMEYIPGQSLQQKIDREGALDVKSILRIGMQTAQALAAAHRQGLVHRDVKPSNILLENGVERVKLGDFGLARAVDDVGITRTGQITGTPQYMSPEQAQGETVDHRSDLFSLGGVLYAMCTGRAAFRADSAVAVLHRVIHEHPKPIHSVNPEIPEWLSEIVEVLLEKESDDRFQTAEDVADLLEAHLAHLQTPENVPQPARLPVRGKHHDDKDPDTALGLFRQNLGNYAIQFAFIAGLFGMSFFIRSNYEGLAGGYLIILGAVFLATFLWMSENWPGSKSKHANCKFREHARTFLKSRPRASRWMAGVGVVVVVGGVYVTSDYVAFENFVKRSLINLGIAQKAPDRPFENEEPALDPPLSNAKVLSPIRTVDLKPKSGFLPKDNTSNRMFFSPDRESLAWVSQPKVGSRHRILVFDTATGKERFQLDSTEEVAAFSPDGKSLAFCGDETDNNPARSGGREGVWLADADTGELQTFLVTELHPSNTRALTFDAKGERLALGHAHNWTTPSGWKGIVAIWDIKTKQETRVLKDHDFRVKDVKFSPDEKHIAVLGQTGELVVWGENQIQARDQTELDFAQIAIDPRGDTLAISGYSNASKNHQILLWNWRTNRKRYLPTRHETHLACLEFSRDGRVLASGDWGGISFGKFAATIRFHDARSGQELAILKGHDSWIQALAFGENGELISASQDGTIKWWDVDSVVPSGNRSNGDELIDSAILVEEFREFYKEHAPKDPSKLESLADPFAVSAGIMQMRMHFPGFLRVTRKQEEDFSKGEFDDAGAKRRIEPMLGSLKDLNVPLPGLTQKIVDEYENRELKDARLELAAHLIQATLAQVKSQFDKAAGDERRS